MTSLCPVCRKQTSPSTAPFCSDSCRHVDLHRWFSGQYAVPAVELDDVEESDFPSEDKGTL